MKRNLIATLSDKNYVDQAKQLFSSVYFNAGWKGDHMLLSHNIPEKELKWFKDKGILVKKCKPLYNKKTATAYVLTNLSKFYLFTEDMKKWQNIVYLDADIIVRASLDDLTRVKGFAAVMDLVLPKLYFHIQISKKLFENLKGYDLKSPAFNAGVMTFSTDLIEKDTFSKMKELFEKYGKNINIPDQATLNLFFYQKWKKLPLIYNVYSNSLIIYSIIIGKVHGIILHFTGGRAGNSKTLTSKKHRFYKEWRYNLDRADKIDLSKIPKGEKWSKMQIFAYSLFLESGNFAYRIIGEKIKQKIGFALKKHAPKIHYRLLKHF